MTVAQRIKKAVKKVTAPRPKKYTLEDLGLTAHVYDGRWGHVFSKRSPNNIHAIGYITFETDGKKILTDLLDAAFHAGVTDEMRRVDDKHEKEKASAAEAAIDGAVETIRALGLDPEDWTSRFRASAEGSLAHPDGSDYGEEYW